MRRSFGEPQRLQQLLFAGVGLMLPVTVQAQSPSVPDAVTSEAQPAVDEVIVTAQKRRESAQDVPIAVSALGTDELESAGISDTLDLKAAVPALQMTTATGGIGLPRIRGIGATGQGPGIENPVAVYVDGVYYGSSASVLQSLYDVNQVAVLKGPQGTLFGRNATGGLIQITTLTPSFTPTLKGEAGYGSFDTRSASVYASSGLADSLAASVSAQYEDRGEGYGTNVVTGSDIQEGSSFAARFKALWNAGERTTVTLSADANGRNASEPAFRNFGLNTSGEDVAQLIEDAGGDPQHDIYSDLDPTMRVRQSGTSLSIDHRFEFASVKSITAYRKTDFDYFFDPDGTSQPRLRIDNSQYDKQFTQELNLLSAHASALQWVVGAFYLSGNAGAHPDRTTGLLTFGDHGYADSYSDVGLESIAAFAETHYALSDATHLITGIRYTRDERELAAYDVSYNGNNDTTTRSETSTGEKTFGKPTWRLSLDHRFSPQLMAYASYNRGFRSGTYIPQATPILLLQPEEVDAYEVGIKSDLFERRVRFNLATYYYDQSNIQVLQVISGDQNIYNADGAHLYGVDGDINWLVTENLALFGGFNYAHARYTHFDNAIISVPYPLPADFVIPEGQSCKGTFGNPYAQKGGNCLLIGDASGNKLQNTPELSFSLGGALDIPTDIGKFTVAGNFYYNGGYVGTPDERVKQASYQVVGASLTWRNPKDSLFVRLWGKNLSDEAYQTQIGATNSGDNGTSAAPRTCGITAGFKF